VGAVGNLDGDLGQADAAEERLVEEMRLLRRAALQGWADERVVATERDVRGQTGMHRQGKKNSAGTRNSAIYPAHVRIRKSSGRIMRKLSVTRSQ